MSSYQYHEFQAIDRPLTPTEQEAIRSLSSRVNLHSTRAVFVYHYGDFHGRPLDILAQYYDAYFYIANWGSVCLAFRFPKELIDTKQLAPYWVGDVLTWRTVGEYLIIEFHWDEEEGYTDWIEGEGYLDGMLSLRDALIAQDYRVLYLAWLSALDSDNVDGDDLEPPVPPGLDKLTPPLLKFADTFQIEESLIKAAATASSSLTASPTLDWANAIANLPREESDAWLLRLAKDEERHLSTTFRRYLQGEDQGQRAIKGQRTADALLALAKEEAKRIRQKAQAEAEARRIEELNAFAHKAEANWKFAKQRLEQGYSGYDEVTQILVKLYELARHQGSEEAFRQRIQAIRNQYANRSALLSRFDRAGLP